MEKNTYKLLKKNIPKIKLHSLSGQYWYDNLGVLIPWSGSTNLPPSNGDMVYNISNNISEGYYMWSGYTWVSISKSTAMGNHEIPIYLESSVDEMGVMVGFDGDIEQIEQVCNFSYTQTGNTLQVYNTVDTSKVSEINEINFTIEWGDTTTDIFTAHTGTTLNSLTKTYGTGGVKLVTISLDTPWLNFKLSKNITVPANISVSNPLGTFSGFTIPYTNITNQTLNYLNDLDYSKTGVTGNTVFNFASVGSSRINEKKLYGSNTYSGVTIGTESGLLYSGYSIDGLYYKDFDDGITVITGATSGYTKEEVINLVVTRNEHFIGFIDEPTIFSDIFVERGKQGVLEKTLRLSEIDNIGELNIYGNGYFNIKKQ
jgi:hypothetical protein